MTPDELRPILAEYRKQVAPAWSKATAHPSFEGADGSPVGQCGVTAAWLQRRLWSDHGIGSTFWVGDLVSVQADKTVRHCWLELDTPEADVIVDLTADQLPGLPPVILAAYDDLFRDGIDYRPSHSRNTVALEAEKASRRLALLESALS